LGSTKKRRQYKACEQQRSVPKLTQAAAGKASEQQRSVRSSYEKESGEEEVIRQAINSSSDHIEVEQRKGRKKKGLTHLSHSFLQPAHF
jgi:hypothetical protein